MRIEIGSDHRGVELKAVLVARLQDQGHQVHDVGPHSSASVDYPDYAAKVAEAVSHGAADRGILICGSGIGMSIAANKFPGIRAALCPTEHMAELSRNHNDANVLCLAASDVSVDQNCAIVDVWLRKDFSAGRHQSRVDKIGAIESALHRAP